ncbi:hypothetical protein HN51_058354 [Arachis hypogaea]|uniref:Transmembrane protein n=1 Tax=Arachis hypogaea TaxID=3818 RepID=A0A444X0Z6_ARAHY|nr:uncharacterized protein LOC107624073 [Arachis ipaensis]XP_025682666.1 uncharacterized protein LOC112783808 [Arachis hypogaea]QHN81628.1 uncharacterized protein DS421_20g688550 [Arachis hypogaea]RYQ83272.1 hypothetical protein Ahy_B10g101921 [Arachis hypogaea]
MILTRHHLHHLFADSTLNSSLRNCTPIPNPSTRFRVTYLNSFAIHKIASVSTRPAGQFSIRAQESDDAVSKRVLGDFDLDSALSVLEFACLLSSAVAWVGFAVIAGSAKQGFLVAIGETRVRVVVAVCGVLMMVGGIAIGAWIRRRQWNRVCGGTGKVNFVGRIEKLEEELRNSATVIRVLSRHIEKLGTRFRVTRQNLKDPIAEAATLAQTNSEATRALAVQSDMLEKELREIQNVLLAMQEQQQKQLDLILAIGKTTKLWEIKRETSEEHETTLDTPNLAEGEVKQKEVHQI